MIQESVLPNDNITELPNDTIRGKERGKAWFQILVILIASLSSLSNGFLFSWTSPGIPQLIGNKEDYDITLDEASYLLVIGPLGMMFSCAIFAKIIDVFGRKWTLWFICIPHATAWLLIANAKSIYVFYLARFISGIGDACLYSSIPTYVGEIATPEVRGSWGNAMSCAIYLGQCLINVIGSYCNIPMTSYICLTFTVAFAFLFALMPESPYFLIMKGKSDDARKSLQILRQKTDVEDELTKLKGDVNRQMSESGTWKDIFTITSNRKAIVAGTFLRLSQQLAGVTVFAVYTQYIFQQAGGSVSASLSSIIYTGICTFFNFTAGFTLDKFGRRNSYFYSCLLSGILLLSESIYFFIQQHFSEVDLSSMQWFPLAGMIAYMVVFSFGLGIVPTLMLGELFSTSIKGKGLCLMNIVYGFLISTISKLFHVLDDRIGLYAPFLLFSICCFISTALSLYFVPETEGKTLEEIQQDLKRRGKIEKKGNAEC